MNKVIVIACIIFSLLSGNYNVTAQHTASARYIDSFNVLQKNSVYFEDDFSDDSVGGLPLKWKIDKKSRNVYVKKTSDGKECDITAVGYFEPRSEPLTDMGGALKIEFDFKIDVSKTRIEVCLYDANDLKSLNGKNYIQIADGISLLIQDYKSHELSRIQRLPDTVTFKKWHRATYYYKKGLLGICIDTNCYFMEDKEMIFPERFDFRLFFVGPIAFRKFKIITTKNISNFNSILTEKKLVTHSINFSKGKKELQVESITYIKVMWSKMVGDF